LPVFIVYEWEKPAEVASAGFYFKLCTLILIFTTGRSLASGIASATSVAFLASTLYKNSTSGFH
jgi:hypothetical protein